MRQLHYQDSPFSLRHPCWTRLPPHDRDMTLRRARSSAATKQRPPTEAGAQHQPMLPSSAATSGTPIVIVVDDDDSIRRAFARLLAAAGYAVETFPSAAALLAREPLNRPECLVLDIRMPALSGLDLQDLLRSTGRERATVFVSAHGDVPSSVRAMKGGAVDFLTKPVDEARLLAAVHQALERDRLAREDREQLGELRQRLETLTPREREVCALVATGRLNKQVAAILGTSEITVKAHRARVMTKMRVKSFADLVRVVDRLGLKDPAPFLGGQ